MEEEHQNQKSKGQFPLKLFSMLETSSDIIDWLPHGRAFRVLNEQSFGTKLSSFYRKLYLWGFKRLTIGPDSGAWHNKSFIRDSPSQINNMIRLKIKDKSKSVNRAIRKMNPDFNSTSALPVEIVTKSIEVSYGVKQSSINAERYNSFPSAGCTDPYHRIPGNAIATASSNMVLHPRMPRMNPYLMRAHMATKAMLHQKPGDAVATASLNNELNSLRPSINPSQHIDGRAATPTISSRRKEFRKISSNILATLASNDKEPSIASSNNEHTFQQPPHLCVGIQAATPLTSPISDEMGNKSLDTIDPIPITDNVSFDDFAQFIDNMVHVL